MNWATVRQQYPDRWLLVEALNAHSEGDRRILEDLAVIETFSESSSAINAYQALHTVAPERELYVVHGSRATLDITERQWLGIRAAR